MFEKDDTLVESTLAKYLEFRIFELIRDRMYDIVQMYSRTDSKEDLYKHLFLCPANISKKRNFEISGVLSPFVCLWRTTLLKWNKDQRFYARSVLPRKIEYETDDGEMAAQAGFLYDLTFDLELSSSSYFKDFRDRVNQDLLDMDRIRYFDINVGELIPRKKDWWTKCELKLSDLIATDNVQKEPRSFDLNAKYTLNITIPYLRDYPFIEKIDVYLNNNLIYLKDIKNPENNIPQPEEE